MRVIRSAHYVQDPAFMDTCDELGLFVIATITGCIWNKKIPYLKENVIRCKKFGGLEEIVRTFYSGKLFPIDIIQTILH